MSDLSQLALGLIPHGYCLSWQPHLLWLHGVSDLVTAVAYYTIPAMLLVFVRRRKDLQFSWIFVLFGVFIMACGATHVMSLWNLWYPDYLASGIVKAVTALASVGTAAILVPLLPKALALPGPAQWKAVHDELRTEVAERGHAEEEVRRLNLDLEQRVAERTAELQAANDALSQLQVELEDRVRLRTAELQETQAKLVATARQAGMAEIATNVLHNVGNVLNSVNVSVGVLSSQVRTSKASGLARAVQMMNEHAADLGHFMSHDDKGKQLPGYLGKLADALAAEQASALDELGQMSKSVDHIKDIVATQQSYAGTSRLVEPVQIRDLVDDALRMNAGALVRHDVTVVKEIAEVPVLPLDRHRVLQILVNLISNAKHAMNGIVGRTHQLTLSVHVGEGEAGRCLRVSVADQGEGIAADNMPRIFSHGFTTRKDGHGFGLHSCILAAQEMGGRLTAHSEGPGLGAVFTLELPIAMEGMST